MPSYSTTRAYRLLILKAYFERGLGVTSFFKYILFGFGGFSMIAKLNAGWFALMFAVYMISCFIVGKLWYEKGFVEIENEISNEFNPFQKEVRKKLLIKKFK